MEEKLIEIHREGVHAGNAVPFYYGVDYNTKQVVFTDVETAEEAKQIALFAGYKESEIQWHCNPPKADVEERPVRDERLVEIDRILHTKLSDVKDAVERGLIKERKEIAKYVLKNWDNGEINGGLIKICEDPEVKVYHYRLWCAAKSRYDQLVNKASREIEKRL